MSDPDSIFLKCISPCDGSLPSFPSERSFENLTALLPGCIAEDSCLITSTFLFDICNVLQADGHHGTPFAALLPSVLSRFRRWRLLPAERKGQPEVLQALALDLAGITNTGSPEITHGIPEASRRLRVRWIRAEFEHDVQSIARFRPAPSDIEHRPAVPHQDELPPLEQTCEHPGASTANGLVYRSGCCACRLPRVHTCSTIGTDPKVLKHPRGFSPVSASPYGLPSFAQRIRGPQTASVDENIPPVQLRTSSVSRTHRGPVPFRRGTSAPVSNTQPTRATISSPRPRLDRATRFDLGNGGASGAKLTLHATRSSREPFTAGSSGTRCKPQTIISIKPKHQASSRGIFERLPSSHHSTTSIFNSRTIPATAKGLHSSGGHLQQKRCEY
ncbi:hypothetical protein BV22DRAFT_1133726 [Leucogyrophana mollusca]|uniref:Uncharacterized protein n=1 Tax=Leucogyrophana mollusca TaxID=85980 RepID=A0ACB8B225_9AGAM|nr:hypothetical protein BV22DRAFT_1133726 [Leucogyrophana mollusca]